MERDGAAQPAFVKKTQKTPRTEIELALRQAKEVT
jgi:phage-related protein